MKVKTQRQIISHHQKYIAKINKAIDNHKIVITETALDEFIAQLNLSPAEMSVKND